MEQKTEGFVEMATIESAATNESGEELKTLYGLIRHLRRNETAGALLNLGDSPLNPLVTTDAQDSDLPSGSVFVHVLLSSLFPPRVPERLPSPWAYVCLEWPSGRLVAAFDLTPFPGLPDVWLSDSDLLHKEFADAVEEALRQGSDIPEPSPGLMEIYRTVLGRFHLAVGSRVSARGSTDSSVDTESISPPQKAQPFEHEASSHGAARIFPSDKPSPGMVTPGLTFPKAFKPVIQDQLPRAANMTSPEISANGRPAADEIPDDDTTELQEFIKNLG